MAKMFYSAKEAAEKLGRSEADLKTLVREGKLREFRDAGSVNYKVADVDGLLAKATPPKPMAKATSSGSQSGEIVLEPADDDSGVSIAPGGSDIVSLEGVDSEDTATGAKVTKKAKEGSSIPSVGVNVFDDDDLDEHVDPLAQTAISDVAGMGLDGSGGGSGILDLTRESDDTSLGRELLDEIYTGEGEPEAAPAGKKAAPKKKKAEIDDGTRAGLDQAVSATDEEMEEVSAAADAAMPRARAVAVQVYDFAPDAVSRSLTSAMVVAVAIMWIGGLGAAAMVRTTMPGLLQTVYDNLMIFTGGSLVLAGIAAGVTYMLAKRGK